MTTNTTRGMICIAFSVALTFWISPVRADWDPADGHKMHFPQLPNPNGWDVNMTFPKVLADDWRCSETGPVADIHFWFSIEQDDTFIRQIISTPGSATLHTSIHADIPASPAGGFSRPGALLWERDFPIAPVPLPGHAKWRPGGTGVQGWYDPNPPVEVRPDDHNLFYQMNVTEIADPFVQQFGTIYWLDLSITLPTGATQNKIGWKTSLQHFNDDAVWGDFPGPVLWNELRDPITQQSLDLSFVITPEPGSLAVLAIGAVGLLRRRS
jgi:hypothetical protein